MPTFVQTVALLAPLVGASPASETPPGELVALPWMESIRPARRVQEPLRWVDGTPSRRTRWFHPTTGVELLRREHVMAAHARVLPSNPVTTPVPVQVELDGVDGPGLGDQRREVWGCTSDASLPAAGPRQLGACYPHRSALADANGNFEPPLPGVDFDATAPSIDDAYAELAVYYHARTFETWLDALELGVEPSCSLELLQANFVRLDGDGTVPVDGAYYTGTCDPASPRFVFGQGPALDYGYDADVVHHELAHGLVDDITISGLWRQSCDALSCGAQARAINEGIADFIAASISDDPHIAEYIAQDPEVGVRNLDRDLRCPDDLLGDPYHDSQIVGGALWRARQRLGDSVFVLLRDTLASVPPDVRFDELARGLLEVGTEQLDEADLRALTEVLEQAGLPSCHHARAFEPGDHAVLVARPVGVSSPWPGPFQILVPVPEGARRIELGLRLTAAYPVASVPSVPRLPTTPSLVAWIGDDGPVQLVATEDDDGRLRIEPRQAGHETRMLELLADPDGSLRLELDVDEGAEAVHLAFANPLPHVDLRLELVELIELVELSAAVGSTGGCRAHRDSPTPQRQLLLVVGLLVISKRRKHPR
ncbi:MAG: hypothetical protein AB1Z98_16875 [Nannocystaceae bacterium]